jgi:hypothetical protein
VVLMYRTGGRPYRPCALPRRPAPAAAAGDLRRSRVPGFHGFPGGLPPLYATAATAVARGQPCHRRCCHTPARPLAARPLTLPQTRPWMWLCARARWTGTTWLQT